MFPSLLDERRKFLLLFRTLFGKSAAVVKTVSGAIVHILDALAKPAISLVCQINPQQDLHGYDNPYPPGGGVNKWDEQWEVGALSDTTGDSVYSANRIRSKNYIPALPDTQYNFAYPSSASASTGNIRVMFYDENKTYLSFRNWMVSGPFTTPANTKFIRFYTNGSYGETYNNDISINYPSTDTAYHPYSNECPISGWTGLNLTRDGKNRIGTITLGSINQTTGQEETGTNGICDYIRVNANNSYVLSSFNTSALALRVFKYDKYKNYLGTFVVNSSTGYFVATTDSNTAYVRLQASSSVLIPGGSYQFESGSSPTTLSPYQGETKSVSWQTEAGTVYGGTLDVTTGVLTVDKVITDLGDFSWNKDSNRTGVFYTAPDTTYLGTGMAYMCSAYKVNNSANANNIADCELSSATSYGGSRLFIKDLANAALTGDQFRTAVDGIQLVAILATPVTYQLDPVTVNLILGENNIWHDANGNTELTYYADGNASTQEALGILLGGAYHNPGGDDDATDDEALGILLGG